MIPYRIFMSLVCVAVVGAMVWDQSRMKQMTPLKWVIAPMLLAMLLVSTWTG